LYISQTGRYTSIDIIRSLKSINKNIHILSSAEFTDVRRNMKEYQYYNPVIEVEYIDFVKELPQLEAPEEVLKYINIYLYHD
ncbi:MAG: alpha/beta hydrolase, partial [Lachnospiraceae bacterium]|nr:alpha/beta hydrolase [Lachnospiraceae bacterium]